MSKTILRRVKRQPGIYRKMYLENGELKDIKHGKLFLSTFIQKEIGKKKGKRLKESFSTLEEAIQYRKFGPKRELLSFVDNSLKFKNLFDQWAIKMQSAVRPQTWARYKSYRNHFLFFEEMYVDEIKPQVIDQWFVLLRSPDYLAKQHSTRLDYHHELTVLKQVLRHYQERFRHDFPWPFLKEHTGMADLGKRSKETRKKDLSLEETKKFCEALKEEANTESDPIYYILMFQYLLALRVQEAAALSYEDFDLERGEVTIRKKVVWARTKGLTTRIEEGTKANPGKTIPLPEIAKGLFRKWVLLNGIRRGFLFGGEESIPSYRQIEYRCSKALRKANLPFTATHVLRHACITEFYASSRDVVLTQKFAGHTSLKSTQRYIGVREDDLRREVENLGKLQSAIEI